MQTENSLSNNIKWKREKLWERWPWIFDRKCPSNRNFSSHTSKAAQYYTLVMYQEPITEQKNSKYNERIHLKYLINIDPNSNITRINKNNQYLSTGKYHIFTEWCSQILTTQVNFYFLEKLHTISRFCEWLTLSFHYKKCKQRSKNIFVYSRYK